MTSPSAPGRRTVAIGVLAGLSVVVAILAGVPTPATAADGGASGSAPAVTPSTGAPTADCTAAPTTVAVGETVTLDASNTTDATSVAFDVDGDGTVDVTDDDDFVVNVSYAEPDQYEPLATARANGTDTASCGTVVVTEAPVPRIGVAPATPVAGETVTLDGSNSTDPDGTVDSYRWLVNGTALGGGSTLEWTPAAAGTYNVTLAVTDDLGVTNATAVTVAVSPPLAAACSLAPTAVEAGEPVVVDATETTGADAVLVDDGDGTDDRRLEPPFLTNVTYDEPGAYRVSITALAEGENGTVERDPATCGVVDVDDNDPPVAAATIRDGPPRVGRSVTLDATNASDPDGSVLEYRWDLDGDGTADLTTADPLATHAFETAGTAAITLRVVDDDGATDTTTLAIEVLPAAGPPTAACSVSPTGVAPGETVVIDASASTNASAVRVDVDGDGTVDRTDADDLRVTATYERAGRVSPRVVVVGPAGSAAADCGTVTVGGGSGPLEDALPVGLAGYGALLAAVLGRALGRAGDEERPRSGPGWDPEAGLAYAAGTLETPASPGTVTATDVGFEPDVLLLWARRDPAGDPGGRARGDWSAGVALRTASGIAQRAESLGVEADHTLVGTAGGAGVDLPRGGGDAEHRLRGRVTATTPEGFELEVDPDGRATVLYAAIRLPPTVPAAFGTLELDPGADAAALDWSVEATTALLSATTAVGGATRTWSTERSSGWSLGTVVAGDGLDQAVAAGSVRPGGGGWGAVREDAGVQLAALDGTGVAGATRASATRLGDALELTLEEGYEGRHRLGGDVGHAVTALGIGLPPWTRPSVGTVQVPTDEPATVDCGHAPGMIEIVVPGPLGAPAGERRPAAGSVGIALPGEEGLVGWVLDPGHGSPDGTTTDEEGSRDRTGRPVVGLLPDDTGGHRGLVVTELTAEGFALGVEGGSGAAVAPGADRILYRSWPVPGGDRS